VVFCGSSCSCNSLSLIALSTAVFLLWVKSPTFVKPQNITTYHNAACFQVPHPIDIGLVVLGVVHKYARTAFVVKFCVYFVLRVISHDANLSPFSQRMRIVSFGAVELLGGWDSLVGSHHHVCMFSGHAGALSPETFAYFLWDASFVHGRTHSAIDCWESALNTSIVLWSTWRRIFKSDAKSLSKALVL
jgi:hypothetical protein